MDAVTIRKLQIRAWAEHGRMQRIRRSHWYRAKSACGLIWSGGRQVPANDLPGLLSRSTALPRDLQEKDKRQEQIARKKAQRQAKRRAVVAWLNQKKSNGPI